MNYKKITADILIISMSFFVYPNFSLAEESADLPDLKINSYSVEKYSDDDLRFDFCVSNAGSARADSAEVLFHNNATGKDVEGELYFDDGTERGNDRVSVLEEGEKECYYFEVEIETAIKEGALKNEALNEIWLNVDVDHKIDESDENNNEKETSIEIDEDYGVPDFRIREIAYKYIDGSEAGDYYYVEVSNAGDDFVLVEDKELWVKLDGDQNWRGDNSQSIVLKKSFEQGDKIEENEKLEFIGPSTEDVEKNKSYRITATVDYNNVFYESHEGNNTKSIDLAVHNSDGVVVEDEEENKKPDLIVKNVAIKHGFDGKKYFWVTVKNIGASVLDRPTLTIKVEDLNINEEYLLELDSFSLRSDGVRELVMKDPVVSPDLERTVVVHVDSEGKISEENESNNAFEKTFNADNNEVQIDLTNGVNIHVDNASRLHNQGLDEILTEIEELRDTVREQNVKIKHLEKLTKNVKRVSEEMENALNSFITYGVDNNTKKLGEGERAAVIYSYKTAFEKLPETEEELADAIKIANGRWPSITNEKAEKRAKAQFERIYKRIADMEDSKDNAAVTVMAYGLRQKAENRNIDSEKSGINTFKNIYGYHPNSTEDWNIMQAITYSGAARGVDTDGDLLVDEREDELGTDKNNPDTDGDGYIDGVEVANGYDPLK